MKNNASYFKLLRNIVFDYENIVKSRPESVLISNHCEIAKDIIMNLLCIRI